MKLLRIVILAALAAILLIVGILTWGSLGSVMMFWCLGVEAAALLLRRFVFTDRENDFAEV